MREPLLVLVRPRSADNLVSIARAMEVFGLREWVAVIPPQHFARMHDVARRKYTPEEVDTLSSLRRVDSLQAAVTGCEVVVGTTMRVFPGKARFTPRELALCQAHTSTRWALVFGAESNGLTDDDLKSCNALSFIPTEPEQPSVNLAQALLLFAYELHAAKRAPPVVDLVALRALRETMAGSLRERGMPRRAADELLAPLIRSALREDERALHEAAWSATPSPVGRGPG